MNDAVLARFLRYVQIDTQANEDHQSCPSTPGQLELLRMLKEELEGLGAAEVHMTEHGYVMATVPATTRRRGVPTVAFLAHVDTAPDSSGKGVKPIVHRRYGGGPIRFPDHPRLVLDEQTCPELKEAHGKDLVTASGKTLLGADDKAGVAVVMTVVERLLQAGKRSQHGRIRVCFTPDEEIGRGVAKLNLKELGADYAYTLDGGAPGEISWETFSANAAVVTIEGVATHPMDARAKGMVNAVCLAARFLALLPRERCAPETTGGYEGFIHPTRVEGRVEKATVHLILRDFELAGLEEKGRVVQSLCDALQAAEPRARVTCEIRKQYRNMAYWLRKDMRPVERAREAMRLAGLAPRDYPVRGGTDGSRLTEMGLPTPNLFCGERNPHGLTEWVAVQDMAAAVATCERLAEVWARPSRARRRV